MAGKPKLPAGRGPTVEGDGATLIGNFYPYGSVYPLVGSKRRGREQLHAARDMPWMEAKARAARGGALCKRPESRAPRLERARHRLRDGLPDDRARPVTHETPFSKNLFKFSRYARLGSLRRTFYLFRPARLAPMTMADRVVCVLRIEAVVSMRNLSDCGLAAAMEGRVLKCANARVLTHFVRPVPMTDPRPCGSRAF